MTPLVAPLRLRTAEAGARKVTWLELFFDLIFVAAVAQVAEPLRHHYAWAELPRLVPLFLLIWWAWTGHSVFATRFDTDDAVQRGLTLVQMFAVAVMAANAKDALGSESSAGLAAAYAAMRLILVGQYLRARRIAAARALTSRYVAGHGTAAVLWLASALVPVPARFWLWAVAFAIDLGTPWLAVRHSVAAPPDAAHLPERFGLFTIILLGDSVVSVMQGIESQDGWTPAAAATAFLAMAVLFLVWWWYFDGVAGASERPVRSRADAVRFHVWSYAHFPLYVGIIVLGVGVRWMVSAASRVTPDAGEVSLVLGAAALVMASLAAIDATSRRRAASRRILVHVALAVLTLIFGLTTIVRSPVLLVGLTAAICLAQLLASLGSDVTTVDPGHPTGHAPDARHRALPGRARPAGPAHRARLDA